MITVLPAEQCPMTGIWVPMNNPRFYPSEYAKRVMNRKFEKGDIMPMTPHGEPSWALREEGTRIENFTGLSHKEIEKINKKEDGKIKDD